MSKDKLKKTLFISLSGISLFYIFFIIFNNYQSIDNISDYISIQSFLFALIPSTLILLLNAYLHTLLIEDIENKNIYNRLKIISIYCNSQIIRYLPGKVLGIVYQSENMAEQIPRKTIWFANFNQMVITNINSMIIACTIYLSISVDFFIALSFLVISLGILYIFIKYNLIYRVSNNLIGKKHQLSLTSYIKRNRVLKEILILQIEWCGFIFSWYLLTSGHISGNNALLMGASYAVASLISMFVFVMPSGWFVREASFIWLGGIAGLGSSMLLIYGILARILFTIADIIIAIALTIFIKTTKERPKNGSRELLG